MSNDIDVRDDPARHRYEVAVDGEVAGFAVYYLENQRIAFVHTEVSTAFEGRGLGSRLARFSLDDARERNLRVVPLCPFYASWIAAHPEYQDLTLPHHGTVLGAHDE